MGRRVNVGWGLAGGDLEDANALANKMSAASKGRRPLTDKEAFVNTTACERDVAREGSFSIIPT